MSSVFFWTGWWCLNGVLLCYRLVYTTLLSACVFYTGLCVRWTLTILSQYLNIRVSVCSVRRLTAMTGWACRATQREKVMVTPKQTLQMFLSPQQTQTTLHNAWTKLWRACRPGTHRSNTHILAADGCQQLLFVPEVHPWVSLLRNLTAITLQLDPATEQIGWIKELLTLST